MRDEILHYRSWKKQEKTDEMSWISYHFQMMRWLREITPIIFVEFLLRKTANTKYKPAISKTQKQQQWTNNNNKNEN